MYLEHFGLKELPFSIAPNPRYLYMTQQHQEAHAHLVYGLGSEGGVILLTGEVGTGKTTISRKLLEEIPENIDIAWIVNPKLSAEELLATICDEFSISYPAANNSIKIFTDLISAHLIKAHGHGRNVIVVIDEAQNLTPEVLEQLRLLTNLETSERKLLQIVLLGQPELKDMLERNDLRQLAQRITARYHLNPLNREESGKYILHRLAVGGCDRPVFSKRAINLIHRFSRGTPRLINLLCDRAMLGVYSRNEAIVKPAHVRQANCEIMGSSPPSKRNMFFATAAAVILMAALATAAVWQEMPDYFNQAALLKDDEQVSAPATATSVPANPIPSIATGTEIRPTPAAEANSETEPDPLEVTGSEGAVIQGKIAVHSDTEENIPTSTAWDIIEGTGTKQSAFRTLAELWQTELSEKDVEPCNQLVDKKLFCLQQRANSWLLHELNRPAMFSIVDNNGVQHFAIIRSIKSGQAIIQLDQQQWKVPLSELKQRWKDQITLIWIKPPGYEKKLQQGDSGKAVEWLGQQLDIIQGTMIPARQFQIMDALLVERLKDFQKSQGLQADGIAGALTLIRINELLRQDIPKLRNREKI